MDEDDEDDFAFEKALLSMEKKRDRRERRENRKMVKGLAIGMREGHDDEDDPTEPPPE